MITGSASTVFDLSPPESCSTMMAPLLTPLEIAHSMYFLGGGLGRMRMLNQGQLNTYASTEGEPGRF